MFKNKYLKQLQDIQSQIKSCTTTLKTLTFPVPDSSSIQLNLFRLLRNSAYGNNIDAEQIIKECEYETFTYLRKLGEYLINIENYHNAECKYKTELVQLQKEERELKEKLGID